MDSYPPCSAMSVLNEPIRFVTAQHLREMRNGVNKLCGEGEVRWHGSDQ